MVENRDLDAARACERLAIASYSLMDQGLYEETVALFAEDAVWVRGGEPVSGKEGILASLNKRPAGDVSRHLITNVLIRVLSDREAVGTACFVPLRGTRREDGTVATPNITNVGDLGFSFRREADGWKITHLQPRMIFKP